LAGGLAVEMATRLTGMDRDRMKAHERRALEEIQAGLDHLVRYDDESIVHSKWIRQRYDAGTFAGLAPARKAAVRTAWHEAGHAVAALAVGTRFSSASIHYGRDSAGRVRSVTAATDLGFVVAAAGQVAERLMDWTMLDRDEDLLDWLATWKNDGGDARRFRRDLAGRSSHDELAAWRRAEQVLAPARLRIRQVARGLLVHPRPLPYAVVAAITEGR
jgi:hypothetical protein